MSIYKKTASKIYGISLMDVTIAQEAKVKEVLFELIYKEGELHQAPAVTRLELYSSTGRFRVHQPKWSI